VPGIVVPNAPSLAPCGAVLASSASMRRTALVFGALGGVLVAVLKLVEYRFLVVEHSLEICGGLVASVCYVATWEVIYFGLAPDFMQKYEAHVLQKARAAGVSEAAIERKRAEMAKFAKMCKNPLINAAITFVEPLPVGLLIATVSALVLRRRRDAGVRN
jgi:hypothetical protein